MAANALLRFQDAAFTPLDSVPMISFSLLWSSSATEDQGWKGRTAADIHTRRALEAGTRGGWLSPRPIEACPCQGSYLQGLCELSNEADIYHCNSGLASHGSRNLGMRQNVDLVASFNVYQCSSLVSQQPMPMRTSAIAKARFFTTERLTSTRPQSTLDNAATPRFGCPS